MLNRGQQTRIGIENWLGFARAQHFTSLLQYDDDPNSKISENTANEKNASICEKNHRNHRSILSQHIFHK